LLGWGDIALGGVEVFDTPGDHETMVTADGMQWGPLLALTLAKARHRAAADGRDKDFSRALRKARGLAAASRHTIEARDACKRGDVKLEIAEYRKALALTEQPLWVRYNLADALIGDGQIDAGLAMMEEAIARDPWPVFRLTRLAQMKVRHSRLQGLDAIVDRAAALRADDTDVMRHYGHLCHLAGRLEEAEAAIRRAIVLDDRRRAAHYYAADLRGYLADLLVAMGRVEEAIVPAIEAAEIKMSDPRHPMRAGRLLARMAREAEARQWYERTLEEHPDFSEATTALAQLDRKARGEAA
jgi:tetratricopeptide (TPR) repeat protein